MKYSNKTLEYYNNLKNIGSFDDDDKGVGTGIVGSPLCGDVMKLQLLIDRASEKIVDAKYKVFGCVSAIASMELVCELLKGKSLGEAREIENSDVADKLGLTPIKRHCSVLAKEAILAAISNYILKQDSKEKIMITISDVAIQKLFDLVRMHGDKCVGIGIIVAQGGCSGINYSLSYQMSDNTDGRKFCEVSGIKCYYEKEDEPLINGINIDVVHNSFGHGFIVTNKNQFSCENCTCKCG